MDISFQKLPNEQRLTMGEYIFNFLVETHLLRGILTNLGLALQAFANNVFSICFFYSTNTRINIYRQGPRSHWVRRAIAPNFFQR